MNIVNKNFSFASSYRSTQRILSPEQKVDRKTAIDVSEKFLENMSLFPEDIDESKTVTELLQIQGTELIPVDTLQESDVVRATFLQKDIDSLPLFYNNPPLSTLDFIVGGESEVLEGNFYRQIITKENSEYPLKPVQVAFEELKSGKAYVAANFTKDTNIKIKEIVLGYYSSEKYQEYLIPIYVFKSIQDEFYAYVIAIPDEWFITENPPTQE